MAASIYEKLSSLCEEIEVDILSREGAGQAVREALGRIKDKAYLDRSPEAEHATQLYRRYRDSTKGGSGSGGFGDNTVAGAAQYLSQPGRPLSYLNEVTEGTSETLVGKQASNTHIFRMRVVTTFLAFIGFIVMASNTYISQGATLTTDYMIGAMCPSKATMISGKFNMSLFQFIAALAFFLFLHNLCFCVFYLLPVDETTGRKYIPGFHSTVETGLNTIGNPSVTNSTRGVMDSCSDCWHKHAKLIELGADASLLGVTLFFVIIGSIEVDRGAQFEMAASNCWFTLGTFYMTYKECMSSGDPAATVRASFAMLYLSMLVGSMCLKYSYDSWQKYKRRYASDDQQVDVPMGRGSAHDGRSLMANQDETDEVVQVDL